MRSTGSDDEAGMIRDLRVLCENGMIRLVWEWEDADETESVRICYKKSGVKDGIGSPFVKEDILPVPHNKIGKAERPVTNECGLYTFAFVPKLLDGSVGEPQWIEHVMLGEPVTVSWRFVRQRDQTVIAFDDFPGKIPAGVVCVAGDGFEYQLDYEVDETTMLLFPMGTGEQSVRMRAREPYDKVYHFCRS